MVKKAKFTFKARTIQVRHTPVTRIVVRRSSLSHEHTHAPTNRTDTVLCAACCSLYVESHNRSHSFVSFVYTDTDAGERTHRHTCTQRQSMAFSM